MNKTRQILELIPDRFVLGGEAIATHQGKKIFIPWGVPGDKLKTEIVEDKKDYARVRIVEILKKSPHRISPPCPYFFKCGGCQWQHVTQEGQLEFKQRLLQDALQRIAKIPEPTLLPPIPSPIPQHYRNRIRLQVSRQGEVGFHRMHSNEVIPIERCLIAEESLNEKIPEAKKLAQLLIQKDKVTRHEIEIRNEENKIVLEPDPKGESGFTQTNSLQNQKLIEKVIEALSLSLKEKVLELFAGEGNFTFPIAQQSAFVSAVEMSETSILKGEKRSSQKHIRNIRWIQAAAHRATEDLWERKEKFDRLLLDPPRRGAIESMESIARLKIPVLVYVSCDPSTLARDLRSLINLGYRHDFTQAIDMFPQTYHVESVTRLTCDLL